MCNRARFAHEPNTLGAVYWWTPKPMDNRFRPEELFPRTRAYVIREQDGRRGIDVMSWDVLGGGAKWPMTNVRNL
jgi:putative SOS response-associated peptidase YedK